MESIQMILEIQYNLTTNICITHSWVEAEVQMVPSTNQLVTTVAIKKKKPTHNNKN